jgi:hypothetical protein
VNSGVVSLRKRATGAGPFGKVRTLAGPGTGAGGPPLDELPEEPPEEPPDEPPAAPSLPLERLFPMLPTHAAPTRAAAANQLALRCMVFICRPHSGSLVRWPHARVVDCLCSSFAAWLRSAAALRALAAVRLLVLWCLWALGRIAITASKRRAAAAAGRRAPAFSCPPALCARDDPCVRRAVRT